MVAFIDEHRDVYGVDPICRELPIALSQYSEAKRRSRDPFCLPRRLRKEQRLMGEIKRVYLASGERYGAQKGWRQLKEEKFAVARCTTERPTAKLGLQGLLRGRRRKTTVSDEDAFARKVVGWRVSTNMRMDLVLDALEQAMVYGPPLEFERVHYEGKVQPGLTA